MNQGNARIRKPQFKPFEMSVPARGIGWLPGTRRYGCLFRMRQRVPAKILSCDALGTPQASSILW